MAHALEPLSQMPVIKFKGQDFKTLRDRCLRRGLLFEDETFPAEISSIGPLLLQGKRLSSLQWERPKDLLMGKAEPHFILEGVSRFDIQQGDAGDCWFLAALGSLTQNPQHLQKILMNQSFSHQYAGIFCFWFWQCGQWVEVVVDDRLPVLNGKYLFVHPLNNQEFWPCLLEKAYAKFCGSYQHLHYGYLPDALVDLTGGVVTSIDLHSSPSDLVTMVKTAAKAGSLMTCATPAGPTGEATRMESGLVSQHAYTVTGAEQIQYRRGWEDLLRLWNPWGRDEWQGRWSDGSPEWQETQDPRKSQLYENKDDGEFWMSCRDFQDNFSCLYVCNQFPVSLDLGHMPHERWSQMTFKNHMTPGNTTAPPPVNSGTGNPYLALDTTSTTQTYGRTSLPRGRRVLLQGTAAEEALGAWLQAPEINHVGRDPGSVTYSHCTPTPHEGLQRDTQYIFSLPESVEGNNVIVSFNIRPQHVKAEDGKFPLNFQVFKVDPQFQHFRERLPSTFFSRFRSADQGIVTKTKYNLTKCFTLSPGTYVAVASARTEVVEFLLRIFLKMPDPNRNLGSDFNLRTLQASLPENGSQQSIFYKYAQQGLSIDATQLQRLLNQEFLKGPPAETFSLDACRGIVALMDLKVNGQLDEEEFSRLWSRLVCCQSVFQNIQRNTGVFLSSDLWRAIKDTGVSVGSELLDLVALRYSDSAGRVSFPSLVCFLMRLEAMAKTFHNLSKDGKGLYLTEVEWMNLVMYN